MPIHVSPSRTKIAAHNSEYPYIEKQAHYGRRVRAPRSEKSHVSAAVLRNAPVKRTDANFSFASVAHSLQKRSTPRCGVLTSDFSCGATTCVALTEVLYAS